MQVRLTKEGQKALGFSPDRRIVNVSDVRAFALMSKGFAARDKGFMALFSGSWPQKKSKMKKVEKPKKEKAVSQKASKREKAV